MTLLLQLHGDLPEYFPSHERRLYIFQCSRQPCARRKGSVVAIRATRISPSSTHGPKHHVPLDHASSGLRTNGIGNDLFAPSRTLQSSVAESNPSSTSASAAGAARNPFSTGHSTASLESALEEGQGKVQASSSDLPATFAQKARIADPETGRDAAADRADPWPSSDALPKPYPSFHLDAEYESLDALPPPSAADHQSVDMNEPSNLAGDGKEDADTFESTIDKTFIYFADRLAQNPLQVLRYDFRGTPLLYSRDDEVGRLLAPRDASRARPASVSGMPRCENCRAERTFELQLTPQAIAELEQGNSTLEGMDWGTIILGVCREDCVAQGTPEGEVSYLEEWVGVQWEERDK
jgi:pre-rRNA-processing protein TSR4